MATVQGLKQSLVTGNTMKNAGDADMVTYQTDSGSQISLSPTIIKQYLVNGQSQVSDQEVMMFLKLCQYQKINPFLREAYLIKYGSSPAQIVTGKELFTKRAEGHASFKGYEAGIIVLTSNGEIVNRTGTTLIRQFNEILIGGWAKVYKDGRTVPYESTAMFDEYKRDTQIWRNMPTTMIRKVALVQALREAFPDILGGLYSQEEMPVDELPSNIVDVESQNNVVQTQSEPAIQSEPATQNEANKENTEAKEMNPLITRKQAQRIFAIANGDKEICRAVLDNFGYQKTTDIKKEDYEQICAEIEERIKEQESINSFSNQPHEQLPFEEIG